jgi:site-specific recombinase XerD
MTVQDVQGSLGHDRLSTTMIYLHAMEEDAKEGQRLLAQARSALDKAEMKILKGGKRYD